MDFSEPRNLLLIGALGLGIAFGITARLSGFCLRSAIIEVANRAPGKQAATWLIALAAAVLATQAMSVGGIVDLSESIYVSADLTWLAVIVGGVAFGFGMVLTRGCGGRHLVLAAGGNLRSWVVLVVLGLSAYMTSRGVFAFLRVFLEDAGTAEIGSGNASLGSLLLANASIPADTANLAIAVILALVCLIAAARIRTGTRANRSIVPGIIIGGLIASGWYVTGVLGFDDFEPIRTESVSFTMPLGNAILYLLTYTGSQADFGMTVVMGVLIGAFIAATGTRTLGLEGFDTPGHLLRYIGGAALMGFGGVLALGCTIGAGLSGVSTLSVVSLLALAAIVVSGIVGHRIKTGVVGGRAPEIVPAE